MAYGEIDGNFEDYMERMESIGIDSWTKEMIPVEYIQTHHEGHDASDEYIAEYIQKKEQGSEFPPIIVKKINDQLYITIDGQHRTKAAESLGEQTIEAYVGVINTETFEDRKQAFKEIHSLEFISGMGKGFEESKKIQNQIYSFIEKRYTEDRPWSSLFFHINPYHFLDWFLQEEYDETLD